MLKAGITGGIGSGKTLIAGIFRLLDIPVYNSDDRAKVLMSENEGLKLELTEEFGKDVYESNGSLDRKFLASKVFNNPEALARLNQIVHPAVGRDFETWCKEQQDVPYVLKEAALIFEAGIADDLDYVITVWAPEDLRISRVIKRDNTTEKDVRFRMQNQWPDRRKILRSDFVVVNDNQHLLIRQVMEADAVIRRLNHSGTE